MTYAFFLMGLVQFLAAHACVYLSVPLKKEEFYVGHTCNIEWVQGPA